MSTNSSNGLILGAGEYCLTTNASKHNKHFGYKFYKIKDPKQPKERNKRVWISDIANDKKFAPLLSFTTRAQAEEPNNKRLACECVIKWYKEEESSKRKRSSSPSTTPTKKKKNQLT